MADLKVCGVLRAACFDKSSARRILQQHTTPPPPPVPTTCSAEQVLLCQLPANVLLPLQSSCPWAALVLAVRVKAPWGLASAPPTQAPPQTLLPDCRPRLLS